MWFTYRLSALIFVGYLAHSREAFRSFVSHSGGAVLQGNRANILQEPVGVPRQRRGEWACGVCEWQVVSEICSTILWVGILVLFISCRTKGRSHSIWNVLCMRSVSRKGYTITSAAGTNANDFVYAVQNAKQTSLPFHHPPSTSYGGVIREGDSEWEANVSELLGKWHTLTRPHHPKNHIHSAIHSVTERFLRLTPRWIADNEILYSQAWVCMCVLEKIPPFCRGC